MIVKLTVLEIKSLVERLDVSIQQAHRFNLNDCKNGIDTSAADREVVQLLGLYYQLKNLLLVEQTKIAQAQQQVQYLTHRRDMLFDYMPLVSDDELISAIESIHFELQSLIKSMHNNVAIDIEMDANLHTLLASKNLIN
jgi:hypothetical protein